MAQIPATSQQQDCSFDAQKKHCVRGTSCSTAAQLRLDTPQRLKADGPDRCQQHCPCVWPAIRSTAGWGNSCSASAQQGLDGWRQIAKLTARVVLQRRHAYARRRKQLCGTSSDAQQQHSFDSECCHQRQHCTLPRQCSRLSWVTEDGCGRGARPLTSACICKVLDLHDIKSPI